MNWAGEDERRNRFAHHPPKDEAAAQRFADMRTRCLVMAEFIAKTVPVGREQATALTKLEEVMFWANAGIARNQG